MTFDRATTVLIAGLLALSAALFVAGRRVSRSIDAAFGVTP